MINTVSEGGEPRVINLSSRKLTETEISLLSKGMKFTPTPKANITELESDIQHYTRKLRLAEFFEDDEVSSSSESDDCDENGSLVQNKSKFNPPHNRDKQLETYINFVHGHLLQPQTTKPNLKQNENQALLSLKNDDSIVIKEADKGGAVVIMDRDYYKDKIDSMLSDINYYQVVDEKREHEVIQKVQEYATQYLQSEELSNKESEFLSTFEVRSSQFYGLPKVHKSQEILRAISDQNAQCIEVLRPNDLKFRPIVGGPQCATHRLSNFLDIILKPIATGVDSYIRDTPDFLNKLPSQVQTDDILVTFDVTALYTNIPHDLGIEAISYWYDKCKHLLPRNFSKDLIIQGVKLVLENNTFKFDGKTYWQHKGTAMGTKIAPTYATLVLGYLEQKLYSSVQQNMSVQTADYIRSNWQRFLDDCFIIWKRQLGDLQIFCQLVNELHEDLEFIKNESMSNLPFLDVMVIKKGNTIETDIYHKATDTRRYLPFNSCHPRHTKQNIPYCLARRVAMVVSDIQTRKNRLNELQQDLQKCGYPKTLTGNAIKKFQRVPSSSLRVVKPQTNTKMITFVKTHNPANPNIFPVIRNALSIMDKSPKMSKLLAKTSIIQSCRQPKNLKRLLTRSKFQEKEDNLATVTKCGHANCSVCPQIIEGNQISFGIGHDFVVKNNMNCATSSVIYCLQCSNCKEFYIGQTGGPLQRRITVHRQHIRHAKYRILQVSHHIASCAVGLNPQFRVFPFYKAVNLTDQEREAKEQYFIRKFKPKLNSI